MKGTQTQVKEVDLRGVWSRSCDSVYFKGRNGTEGGAIPRLDSLQESASPTSRLPTAATAHPSAASNSESFLLSAIRNARPRRALARLAFVTATSFRANGFSITMTAYPRSSIIQTRRLPGGLARLADANARADRLYLGLECLCVTAEMLFYVLGIPASRIHVLHKATSSLEVKPNR